MSFPGSSSSPVVQVSAPNIPNGAINNQAAPKLFKQLEKAEQFNLQIGLKTMNFK